MKLLKYPLAEHGKGVNALATIGKHLLLADADGHVQVWAQQKLVEASFDGSKIKDLSMELSIPVTIGHNKNDRSVVFLLGDQERLFIGSEQRVVRYQRWLEGGDVEVKEIFSCKPPSTITDVKFDPVNNVLFVLQSKENRLLMFDATSLKELSQLQLAKNSTPITGVLDPMGQIFTLMVSDRSVLVYQYNAKGALKLIQKVGQSVNINPIHYKITMSPQADLLPVINSLKGSTTTTSTSILLLDRNDNYKTSTTLVSIPSNKCKVLKFSPKIYEKTNSKKGTKMRYNLLATSGSKDGTVVVWNTKRVKPLFNAIQVSETPIVDMSWSEDGLKLFVISNDNVLYNFAFQDNDLGEMLDENETKRLQAMNKTLSPLPEPKEHPQETIIKSELEKASSFTESDNSKNSNKKAAATKKKISPQALITTQNTMMEFSGPSYNVPKDLKRKPKAEAGKEGSIQKKPKKELEPMDFLDNGLILPVVSFSKVRLASPKVRLTFKYSPPLNTGIVLEVRNGSGNEQKPTIIALISEVKEQERTLFQDFLPKFVNMCTAGNMFWACSSSDGTIYIYSDSGKKILPPLCLGVPCSFLEACENYLLCITSIGQMFCWDISAKKLLFPINTVYPLLNPSLRYSDDILTRAENITMCAVTHKGVPLITLSNGDGFMFDKDMETWLLISDGWWAYGSQYWDMTNLSSFKTNDDRSDDRRNNWTSGDAQRLTSKIIENKESVVNYVERKTNDELSRKGRIKNLQRFARTILMKEGYENLEEIVTLSHLENRLLVTLRLDDQEEFSNILSVYCIRLSELGYSDRLDEVLQWLYNNGDMDSMIAGNARRALLESVLVHCSDFRHVQRVTTSYASALGWYDKKE